MEDRSKEGETLLIIDAHNVCFAALYSTGSLSYGDRATGIIYGFLRRIFSLAKEYHPDKIVFAWDSRKRKRALFYPDYKINRKNKSEEELEMIRQALPQFSELRTTVLPRLGFNNNFIMTGYEADDIIAHIVYHVQANHYIMSGDQDLYQLLGKRGKFDTVIINPRTNKVFDADMFRMIYGIEPHQWTLAKAIGGCVSDNVEGIEGVADPAKSEKSKALAYIKGTLDHGVAFDRIVSYEGQQIINRNMQLVFIPYFSEKEGESLILREDEGYSMDWLDLFDEYGFRSFEKEIDELKELFKLKKGRRNG